MNDLLIFVSYAVPRKRFSYFFSFTRYFPNSFCQKCHNFSKQISLSYKNRLFFFHKIIHIITSQWYNLFVKVNSKAVLKVNIVRETEMWSLAPYSSTPPPSPSPQPPTHLHRYDSSESIRWIRGNPLPPTLPMCFLDSKFCIFWLRPDSQPWNSNPNLTRLPKAVTCIPNPIKNKKN